MILLNNRVAIGGWSGHHRDIPQADIGSPTTGYAKTLCYLVRFLGYCVSSMRCGLQFPISGTMMMASTLDATSGSRSNQPSFSSRAS